MHIVIIGGGIAAVYAANHIKALDASHEVTLLSNEAYAPYDRIHLCRLINHKSTLENIALSLHQDVKLLLNQSVTHIDRQHKNITSNEQTISYDKLILATGSTPLSLIDVTQHKNCAVFRSASDAKLIAQHAKQQEVVIIGSGPIALELLETLKDMPTIKAITLLVRAHHLYSKELSRESQIIIEKSFLQDSRVRILYDDEIINYDIEEKTIKAIDTKSVRIDNPFVVFGIGIMPAVETFKPFVETQKGVVVNAFMQSNHQDIYAIGECAQVKEYDYIAGHVKQCTQQAQIAVNHMLGNECEGFTLGLATDMLKVGEFDLVEVCSANFEAPFEKVVIHSKEHNRVDEYFLKDKQLIRFIGINSNVDIAYLESMMDANSSLDLNYVYENRLIGERGRLICSCEHLYHQDLVDLVVQTGVDGFETFKEFSSAGRVCGRCKTMIEDVIAASQELIDPLMPRKTAEQIKQEKELKAVEKRLNKFKRLHPLNQLDETNLEAAMKMVDVAQDELNSWVSMVTANMQLHPAFEPLVKQSVKALNKVPIIWLELSDCSGNSEAFIKTTNPTLEDLIFDYISLDYHELLMSASGNQSETVLEEVIHQFKNEYVLIVEGAIPLGLDGKYLRIGPKGETGLALLQRCAKDAALILAVGSCAFDGGVVAASPNPTNAVGVAQALQRDDVINITGCPTNPVNIVGTLLSYLMFEELPKLDEFNRPLWAYEGRVHDNCERRGHYELGEFVKQWGDEGAKKGWCLFEMGCKGPYAHVNCPTMKFNQGTSWPVQAGHGCMGCTEKGFFDKFANERPIQEGQET